MKAAAVFVAFLLAGGLVAAPPDAVFARARENGRCFEDAAAASQRVLKAWLTHADAKTLLLPDRPLPDRAKWLYTPHNSGADLYPYLILTAHLTDPDLYQGRMLEMSIFQSKNDPERQL